MPSLLFFTNEYVNNWCVGAEQPSKRGVCLLEYGKPFGPEVEPLNHYLPFPITRGMFFALVTFITIFKIKVIHKIFDHDTYP